MSQNLSECWDQTTWYIYIYFYDWSSRQIIDNHSAIILCCVLIWRLQFDPDQSSFVSLCVVEEEGHEVVNHGYRRNVEEHVIKVDHLGEKWKKKKFEPGLVWSLGIGLDLEFFFPFFFFFSNTRSLFLDHKSRKHEWRAGFQFAPDSVTLLSNARQIQPHSSQALNASVTRSRARPRKRSSFMLCVNVFYKKGTRFSCQKTWKQKKNPLRSS